jgi:hypothetical protein
MQEASVMEVHLMGHSGQIRHLQTHVKVGVELQAQSLATDVAIPVRHNSVVMEMFRVVAPIIGMAPLTMRIVTMGASVVTTLQRSVG